MKNLTIRDIASMAGVSPAAVSFVLNNKGGVSEKTKERILQIIAQTGFTPNVHTRRLNLRKSFNINLAIKQNVSTLTNLFYMEILLGILSESRNYDYNIVLSDISDLEREKHLLRNIKNSDTDGIIFIQDPSQYIITEVEEADLPHIIVDTQNPNHQHTVIRLDYEEAARTSVEYLISKGHKSIAFIGMEKNPGFYVNTFNGYRAAIEAASLAIMPNWIQSTAYDESSSYACMDRILSAGTVPTAVFCASDIFAYSSMQCAKDKGYGVPEDISFLGMDDIHTSKYMQPPLSTLHIDEEYMGKSAMRLIDKMINGEKCESIILSSTTIIERKSVRDLREGN
ncbi:MAG: LacI family DNA-binding transcriptional regulator [Oscillospiraceae bacterium]|nr:LacI family DNA-binding transcriptional regulator [Oscillospiraceae bacterium]